MLKVAGSPVESSFVLSTAVESSFVLKVTGSPVKSSGVQFCVEYSSGVQWSPVLC